MRIRIYYYFYLEDIEYIQASSIKDLEMIVRSRIEKEYGTIEQNPFWDEQTKQWTQVVLYYNDGEEDEEK